MTLIRINGNTHPLMGMVVCDFRTSDGGTAYNLLLDFPHNGFFQFAVSAGDSMAVRGFKEIVTQIEDGLTRKAPLIDITARYNNLMSLATREANYFSTRRGNYGRGVYDFNFTQHSYNEHPRLYFKFYEAPILTEYVGVPISALKVVFVNKSPLNRGITCSILGSEELNPSIEYEFHSKEVYDNFVTNLLPNAERALYSMLNDMSRSSGVINLDRIAKSLNMNLVRADKASTFMIYK